MGHSILYNTIGSKCFLNFKGSSDLGFGSLRKSYVLDTTMLEIGHLLLRRRHHFHGRERHKSINLPN